MSHFFQVDDIVTCQGAEYIVTKCNPANLKARHLETGKSWNIPRYAAVFVRKAVATDYAQKIEAISQSFVLGAVVQFANNAKAGKSAHVVLGISSSGLYRVAKLGGDGDRYYKNIPASSLKAVSSLDLPSLIIHG